MQRVLSNELWKVIRSQARKARQRKAAIAYVTRDLIGFRKGDQLVVDASVHAISSGETSAPLLDTLRRRGVRLYHCADLHAKVLLLGDSAVVGSGNMSDSSASLLVEAGVLSDHSSVVSGVASLIEQLVHQSESLNAKRIAELCAIKVIRRGGPATGSRGKRRTRVSPLGNRTWLVGVHEMVRKPRATEQKMIEKAGRLLKLAEDDLHWIRWGGRSRFIRECREGDSVIQIWSPPGSKQPAGVLQAAPVLLKQRTRHWTRFYHGAPTGKHAEMPWGVFKRMLKKLGYARHIGPNIAQLIEPEMADAIARIWKTVKRR